MGGSLLVRLGKRVAFYLGLFASLFVFPAWLPWMIAPWLAAYGIRVGQGKSGWPPLAFVLGIVLIKRVDWAPGLLALGLAVVATGLFDYLRKGSPRFALPILAISWAAMAWDWHAATRSARRPTLDPARPIACVGDSILVLGFSRELGPRVRVPVRDHSAGGITAAHALERFPRLLAENPQAVLIELGGHDYLQGRPRRETRDVLESMILQCRSIGAEPILFEVPRGLITDSYGGLERELARKYDLEVINDGAFRSLVLFSRLTPLGATRHLSYDGLHPNDEGHRFLADRAAASLGRLYGPALFR